MDKITIRRPDDWHVHLRDGAALQSVAVFTATQFGRAIVMPNLTPPLTTVEAVDAYRARIMAALPAGSAFEPLMTLYLTDGMPPETIRAGKSSGTVTAAKLYPAHATTNSAHGVTAIDQIMPALEAMADVGMPLCVHGEVTDREVDIFDREAVFIDRTLAPLVARLPALKVIFEHITTRQAVDFVQSSGPNIAATITPQHLHLNRNAIFDGGLRPHAYCLPVLKGEEHRRAVRAAAVSGSAKFFLGTDSAPHLRGAKESSCGCAGIFNAPFALESYLQVFDEDGALDRFEGFASEHGARFYGLPLNESSVTLERAETLVPGEVNGYVPFHAGEALNWRVKREESGSSR
ncbi:MAG TPA: dihydroorotase [Sphingomonas sp.]|jgi:dihydroorotase|nr:dihydroorotase [Sphingomonas sp.]